MPGEGRFLCAGVGLGADGPVLRLTTPDGRSAPLPLNPGVQLTYRVLDADTRWCLGWWSVADAERRTHHACPRQLPATSGYACPECRERDEVRHQHNSHRTGHMGEGLRRYLAQPHWLYIATFANGATKVGTASEHSRTRRLTEQGALCAQYVARARDGLAVRVLEDAVSSALGLPQAVRAADKARGLSAAFAGLGHGAAAGVLGQLEDLNARAADRARDVLTQVGLAGFEIVHRRWRPPESHAAFLAGLPAQPYPLDPGAGEHGFAVLGVLGSTLLAAVPGPAAESDGPAAAAAGPAGPAGNAANRFLADLAQLRGRRLRLGPYASLLPARQQALFEVPSVLSRPPRAHR